MRSTILAAALILGAAAPAAAAFVTSLDDGQGRKAWLRWKSGTGGVRWSLSCLDMSDPRKPDELFTYKGIAPAEVGFVEGRADDVAVPGRFVLATRGLSPYLQIWLQGCPANGRAVLIRQVR
jgi:hypothetical protein